MNQKAKDFIKSNILDLESNNRMDSTGYVRYAISEPKAYGAILIAEEEMKEKATEAFRLFTEKYCAESGRTDVSEESEYYVKVFNELINS